MRSSIPDKGRTTRTRDLCTLKWLRIVSSDYQSSNCLTIDVWRRKKLTCNFLFLTFLMYLILNKFGSVLTCDILGGNKDKAVFSVKLKQITYKSLGFWRQSSLSVLFKFKHHWAAALNSTTKPNISGLNNCKNVGRTHMKVCVWWRIWSLCGHLICWWTTRMWWHGWNVCHRQSDGTNITPWLNQVLEQNKVVVILYCETVETVT